MRHFTRKSKHTEAMFRGAVRCTCNACTEFGTETIDRYSPLTMGIPIESTTRSLYPRTRSNEQTTRTPSTPPVGRSPEPFKDEDTPTTEQDDRCVICLDNKIRTVLVPCGHAIMCFGCANEWIKVGTKECPICNIKHENIFKFFKG
jgi:hypothetical protein